MNEQRAQQLVVGCLAASAAVAAGSALADDGELPGVRLVVGVAFTGVGLATVAMFAPDLAGGFAALILTTTVFLYGKPLMDAVTEMTGQAAPAARRHRNRTTPPRKVEAV